MSLKVKFSFVIEFDENDVKEVMEEGHISREEVINNMIERFQDDICDDSLVTDFKAEVL